MATNYGVATNWLNDRPLISTMITDPRLVIGQNIVRCWDTPRGALAAIGDDPNFGENITQYVNAKLGPGAIAAAEQSLLSAAMRDPRVKSGTVTITFDRAGNMTVNGQFAAADGPFTLVANVNAITAAIVFTFEPQ